VNLPDNRYIQYEYNEDGKPSTLRTPGGTIQYNYDTEGRLSQVIDSEIGQTSYGYDLAGRIISETLPDGSTTNITRNNRGWTTGIKTTAPDNTTVICDKTISYDATGNPVHIIETDSLVTINYDYEYDKAGRVIQENRSGSDTENLPYQYDDDWNLVQMGDRNLTYDGTMRLLNDGYWTNYTCDAVGRPVSRSRDTTTEEFTYDAMNRLVRFDRTGNDPTTILLTYSHDNLLSHIEIDGTGRHLVWDTTRQIPLLLEEWSDNGDLIRRYVHGIGPVAVITEDQTRILHQDSTGNISRATSLTGEILERYVYNAYSEKTTSLAPSNPLRYASEYFIPELNLVYMRARFYDPRAGRFLTPDLMSTDSEQPQTYNPYTYVGGNPLRFRDPLGTMNMVSISVTMTVINIIASIALPHFPSPVLWIAEKFGWHEGNIYMDDMGVSVAFAVSKGFLTGGIQVDVLKGPNKWMGVLYLFAGGQIGSARGDTRLASPQYTFWAGSIFGIANEDPTEPRGGIYILFGGTMARILANVSGKGRDRNKPVTPSWSRWAAAIQWELVGVSNKGEWGHSNFLQAFTVYGSYWGNAMPPEFTTKMKNIKKKLSSAVFNSGISITFYVPLLWFTWDGSELELSHWFE
jgi:RHS repeat-associated protein